VTLLGARLLGARVAAAHTAVPARWFDQRHNASLWHEISAGPAGRGSFADKDHPHRRRSAEQYQDHNDDAVKAQEESNMHKVNGIGKFLEIGSVVQGAERGPRWFSLPGSWRAPRIQIMQKSAPSISVEHDDRRTARMLTPAAGPRGW